MRTSFGIATLEFMVLGLPQRLRRATFSAFRDLAVDSYGGTVCVYKNSQAQCKLLTRLPTMCYGKATVFGLPGRNPKDCQSGQPPHEKEPFGAERNVIAGQSVQQSLSRRESTSRSWSQEEIDQRFEVSAHRAKRGKFGRRVIGRRCIEPYGTPASESAPSSPTSNII
jgi:hypothetical protein